MPKALQSNPIDSGIMKKTARQYWPTLSMKKRKENDIGCDNVLFDLFKPFLLLIKCLPAFDYLLINFRVNNFFGTSI